MNPVRTDDIEQASEQIGGVVSKTPLEFAHRLSEEYGANIYIKREDLQPVRSYKLRGAYNFLSSLDTEERKRGVVCASAGNHAQGVAYSASRLKVKAVIYMPETTPRQKVDKVKSFGGKWSKVILTGTSFDECNDAALAHAESKNAVYVHPFDDYRTIAGQGTIGVEVLKDLESVDYLLLPIGGGGLLAGVGTYFRSRSPKTKIFGIEPQGAASMAASMEKGRVTTLDTIDPFIDGAAVKKVGTKTFKVAKTVLDDLVAIPEGAVCTTMIELYQKEGIIAEPAGALSISALEQYRDIIGGKTVVCILSGGNNDLSRYPEIVEKSLVYQGLKHYFIVEFFQKPGELKTFLNKVLGRDDDIARFEYIKRTNKEKGPALVGIELAHKEDFAPLVERMKKRDIHFRYIPQEDMLYNILI